jgi:1,4-dihydroxy-2-naphthoate octaprenyltransferase
MDTEWVFTGSVGAVGALASVALGAVAAAALAVNNHRDAAHDRRVGRRTFAVVFGPRASTVLYGTLLLVPFALLPAMAWLGRDPWLLLPALALPSAWRLRRAFADCPPGVAFNEVLFRTFRLELWFAALLSAGAVIGRAAASA